MSLRRPAVFVKLKLAGADAAAPSPSPRKLPGDRVGRERFATIDRWLFVVAVIGGAVAERTAGAAAGRGEGHAHPARRCRTGRSPSPPADSRSSC